MVDVTSNPMMAQLVYETGVRDLEKSSKMTSICSAGVRLLASS